MTRPNVIMADAYIWTLWRRGSVVVSTAKWLMQCVRVLSWHPDVRGVEDERTASSQGDWQRYNARLESFSFPDQWATEHSTTELPRLHHRRAWWQQRYVHVTVFLFLTPVTKSCNSLRAARLCPCLLPLCSFWKLPKSLFRVVQVLIF